MGLVLERLQLNLLVTAGGKGRAAFSWTTLERPFSDPLAFSMCEVVFCLFCLHVSSSSFSPSD